MALQQAEHLELTSSLGVSSGEGVLMGRPSKYSPELEEQAVELARASDETVAQVARDLSSNDPPP